MDVSNMKKKYFSVVFLVLVLLACVISSKPSMKVMKNIMYSNGDEVQPTENKKSITIVLDPGHGGRDPGKVGVNNALEKEINLSIAFKLKDLLELNDINVIMTREDDQGLYSETDSNKKNADLRKRIEIIHSNDADFAVSIHQNSFQDSSVKGAQVFYHKQSDQGKRLAEIIQEQLITTLDDGNRKKAKSNNNYYMLTRTQCPLVIVECGYMSNYQEAELLKEEEYQKKLAWAIHLGMMQYINNEIKKEM